ncbi:putative RING-H2 finger protein ATL36 [Chenopodium quinoa]|uniref:putative RING-H2 finger protein ATL36 n=1 Tax=Chenopodium quinoa TaxID=63459 RepID=UPI000B7943D2|nr:putative RING-H2 finger protein ATL36 [Chenopodium quinoa]
MFLLRKYYYDASGFFITLILFSLLQPRLLVRAQSIDVHHPSESNWNKGLLVAAFVVLIIMYKHYYNASGFFITLILFSMLQPRLLVRAQSIHVYHSSEPDWNKGFLVGSFVVLLIVVYFVLVRNWLNRYQWWSASETTTQQAQGGLNPSVLESFPVFIYSEKSGLGLDKGSLECSVCLSQFEMDEKLRMLPKCKHVFHVECVNRWLVDHSTCPFCRDDLAPRPGESTQMKLGCVGGSGSRSGTEVVEGANDIV